MEYNKCHICQSILSDDDLNPYSSCDDKSILLCRKHWCECLPENIPWEWIRRCKGCNDMVVCRGCYRNDNLCLKCYRKSTKL